MLIPRPNVRIKTLGVWHFPKLPKEFLSTLQLDSLGANSSWQERPFRAWDLGLSSQPHLCHSLPICTQSWIQRNCCVLLERGRRVPPLRPFTHCLFPLWLLWPLCVLKLHPPRSLPCCCSSTECPSFRGGSPSMCTVFCSSTHPGYCSVSTCLCPGLEVSDRKAWVSFISVH